MRSFVDGDLVEQVHCAAAHALVSNLPSICRAGTAWRHVVGGVRRTRPCSAAWPRTRESWQAGRRIPCGVGAEHAGGRHVPAQQEWDPRQTGATRAGAGAGQGRAAAGGGRHGPRRDARGAVQNCGGAGAHAALTQPSSPARQGCAVPCTMHASPGSCSALCVRPPLCSARPRSISQALEGGRPWAPQEGRHTSCCMAGGAHSDRVSGCRDCPPAGLQLAADEQAAAHGQLTTSPQI